MTAAFFVTGTGTGVGKTYATAALAGALRRQARPVVVLKPVLSGFDPAADPDHDASVLLRAVGADPLEPGQVDRIAPWRFALPLSPDMAARREGRTIRFDDLVAFCRLAIQAAPADGIVLVEGVGGAMVPLDDRHTVRDWVAALRIPALVVGGTYLGAISHALTTLAALAAAAVPVAALVLSESEDNPVEPDETRDVVRRHAGPIAVHLLRRGCAADAERLAASLLGD